MNFLNKIKQFFIKYWKHILILLLIFIIAFGFRTLILRYDLMFEFDSYWHTRMNADWISSGEKPILDTMGTYHNANKSLITPQYSWFFWGTGVVAYKLVYLGAQYTQENWIALVRILPALYGALTALAIYLLFKWAYNSNIIGYIAGFIGAVMPAFIYRQMGGFYEEDSYGFLWFTLGFAFLIKALKDPKLNKENIIYATLSGLMFGIMAFTWSVFVIVPVLLEAYFVIYLIYCLIKKVDKKKIIAFLSLFAIIFAITGILGALANTNWLNYQVNYAKGIFVNENLINTQKNESSSFAAKSVGEESMGIGAFPNKYGMFLPFIFLFIIAFIYSLYKNRNIPIAILSFVIGFATMYLAYNKLKATYWFGIGLTILAAFTIATLIIAIKEDKIKKSLKIFLTVLTGFLLFGGIASGVIFTFNHTPNIVSEQGWIDSLEFMKNDLPENAKMFNWWSWGHWITYIGHKRASTDNTNADQQANGDFSAFVLEKDLNKALGIIKAYDSDYIVISYDTLLGINTYQMYANVLEKNAYNISNNIIIPFGCQQINYQNYQCTSLTYIGNQRLSFNPSLAQLSKYPTNYTTNPISIWQNKLPVIYYLDKKLGAIFMLDLENNKRTMYKLWFNDPEITKYFTKVHDNGAVKIWKVNKEEFTNIKEHMTGLTHEEVLEWNSKLYWLNE